MEQWTTMVNWNMFNYYNIPPPLVPEQKRFKNLRSLPLFSHTRSVHWGNYKKQDGGCSSMIEAPPIFICLLLYSIHWNFCFQEQLFSLTNAVPAGTQQFQIRIFIHYLNEISLKQVNTIKDDMFTQIIWVLPYIWHWKIRGLCLFCCLRNSAFYPQNISEGNGKGKGKER